uniref:Variant surface glycoprotein n=1 Tax=Trypanosoma brucei TaxID=5691 RepID=S5G6K0_9TRYP|nr:variant surface glycoprotein [Trypanosoma brucei]
MQQRRINDTTKPKPPTVSVRCNTLISAVIAALLVITKTEGTAGNAMSKAAATRLCKLSQNYIKTTKGAIGAVKQWEQKINNLQLLHARLQTAACAGPMEDQPAIDVLVTFVGNKINSYVNKLTAMTQKAIPAAAASMYAAGHIKQTIDVFAAAKGSNPSNRFCLHLSGGDSGAGQLNTLIPECSEEVNFDGTQTKLEPEFDYANSDESGAVHTAQNTNAQSCQLTDAGSSKGYTAGEATAGSGISWAGGLFKVSTGSPTMTSVHQAKAADAGATPSIVVIAAKHNAELSACEQAPEIVVDHGNFESWKADGELQQSVEAAHLAQAQITKLPAGTTKDELRKKLVGDTQAEFNSKIWDKLKEYSVEKSSADEIQTKTLKELSTKTELEEALARCQQKRRQETTKLIEEAKIRKQMPKEKQTERDETCEKKGTGDNCKEGCKEVEEGGKKKCVKNPDYRPKQVEGGEKKLIKCSDATTEEECKKVEGKKPEGKNAVCGWIDYVDGRGKLPKHECLDGCFIGGKQFAIIAAAFVALLF